ncbi:hypothetical protein LCGC14_2967030 [marine sediment metagenome]|uniref:Uncharacterized protein n=1 Tax=marine sediment metagenome TaxID=412755 RepID=A0A0F8ZI98_9ZZZZ
MAKKVRMMIEIPADGIELKLTNGGMIGTLTIESTGIKFDGVKAKVKSDRLMTWQILKNLSKSGLI